MKQLDITITVTVDDDVTPNFAGESMFLTATQFVDHVVIASVDDWKVNHA